MIVGEVEDEVLSVLYGAKDEDYFGHTIRLTLIHRWYKERVQRDLLTQCAHLYMLCEKVFCSHTPSIVWELKVTGKRKTTT